MASNSFLTEEDVPGAECVQPSIVEHTRSGWPGKTILHTCATSFKSLTRNDIGNWSIHWNFAIFQTINK